MARGIKVPLVRSNGRLRLESGDDYIGSLVSIAMGNGDSDNAFQWGIGLGESMIFGINDPLSEGDIRQRALRALKSLEIDQLAEFSDLSFRTEGAEKFMDLGYNNLETGARIEVEIPLNTSAQ